ncbi:MAG TPA: hypothetical protein VNH80_13095 [Burkholderiales bacterium]|nr:hypothetical protein [Burkholderiales bacterium]
MATYKPIPLPRGRIAQWSRERLEALSITELRQLMDNAQRLKEAELAATCQEILTARPNGMPRAPRRAKAPAEAK